MSTPLEEFYAKFRVEELLLSRSAHWSWSLRPVHATLGAGVLSLNRYAERMSDLTADEAADLPVICRTIETALAEFSRPGRINYLMLMMVDPHLHFHVLPRYEEAPQYAGLAWPDGGWPGLPRIADNADRADHPGLLEIRDALREHAAG